MWSGLGLEPETSRTVGRRSTNWANRSAFFRVCQSGPALFAAYPVKNSQYFAGRRKCSRSVFLMAWKLTIIEHLTYLATLVVKRNSYSVSEQNLTVLDWISRFYERFVFSCYLGHSTGRKTHFDRIFILSNFFQNQKALELKIMIFENNSPKGILRQNMSNAPK